MMINLIGSNHSCAGEHCERTIINWQKIWRISSVTSESLSHMSSTMTAGLSLPYWYLKKNVTRFIFIFYVVV
jgi:hypothetical protein